MNNLNIYFCIFIMYGSSTTSFQFSEENIDDDVEDYLIKEFQGSKTETDRHMNYKVDTSTDTPQDTPPPPWWIAGMLGHTKTRLTTRVTSKKRVNDTFVKNEPLESTFSNWTIKDMKKLLKQPKLFNKTLEKAMISQYHKVRPDLYKDMHSRLKEIQKGELEFKTEQAEDDIKKSFTNNNLITLPPIEDYSILINEETEDYGLEILRQFNITTEPNTAEQRATLLSDFVFIRQLLEDKTETTSTTTSPSPPTTRSITPSTTQSTTTPQTTSPTTTRATRPTTTRTSSPTTTTTRPTSPQTTTSATRPATTQTSSTTTTTTTTTPTTPKTNPPTIPRNTLTTKAPSTSPASTIPNTNSINTIEQLPSDESLVESSTAINPLISNVKENMLAMGGGYFLAFLHGFCGIMSGAYKPRTNELFEALDRIVDRRQKTGMYDAVVGDEFGLIVKKGTEILAELPDHALIRYANDLKNLLEVRQVTLDDNVNKLIEELDLFYSTEEGEELLQSLVQIAEFPKDRTADSIMEEFHNRLFYPFMNTKPQQIKRKALIIEIIREELQQRNMLNYKARKYYKPNNFKAIAHPIWKYTKSRHKNCNKYTNKHEHKTQSPSRHYIHRGIVTRKLITKKGSLQDDFFRRFRNYNKYVKGTTKGSYFETKSTHYMQNERKYNKGLELDKPLRESKSLREINSFLPWHTTKDTRWKVYWTTSDLRNYPRKQIKRRQSNIKYPEPIITQKRYKLLHPSDVKSTKHQSRYLTPKYDLSYRKFQQKKSHLKLRNNDAGNILKDSGYSSIEEDLKFNLQDAIRHPYPILRNDTDLSGILHGGRRMELKKKSILDESSYSDEESVIKTNIYKAINKNKNNL